jgi:hypothetical protein
MFKTQILTSHETHHVSATKPNRLMLFIVRTIQNTQIHCVGRMQSFSLLKQVVHRVTTGLKRVDGSYAVPARPSGNRVEGWEVDCSVAV